MALTFKDMYIPQLDNAPRIAAKFQRMIASRDADTSEIATFGSQVHVRGIVSGSSMAFVRPVMDCGARRICLIMDMSGSMMDDFIVHGSAFILALHQLNRKGVLHVDIWLSGGGRCAKIPATAPDTLFSSLMAGHGYESLGATLQTASADATAADTVLVYTDGDITDGDVDCAKWRARGVDLIGCAVGEGSQLRRRLVHHFGCAVMGDNPFSLATAIMAHVLKHDLKGAV
jgi:hypothetical protein